MKKLLSAILAITLAVSSYATGTENVNSTALSNFKYAFKRASDVSWTLKQDYIKATFLLDNVRTEALYTPEGDFIGTNTAVSLDELPVRAKRTFAKKFDGHIVKEAVRFEGVEEGAYFLSAESEKEAVILKVTDSGQVSIMKTSKK